LSKTQVSIIVYSIYLTCLGLSMALIPNVLFGLLGLPPTSEVWVRLFGFLALLLTVKGMNGALTNNVGAMQLDVFTRAGFAIFLTALIVMGLAAPILMIGGAVDFLAAVWTQVALVKDRHRS
jgi:hypothetical protein